MHSDRLTDKIVASGTWLYDGAVPQCIQIYVKPARFAWSRYEDHNQIDESRPIPNTKDGFLYYFRLADWGEYLTIEDAKTWADAQPWGQSHGIPRSMSSGFSTAELFEKQNAMSRGLSGMLWRGSSRVAMTENADEERLRQLEAYAENAYSEMYDAGNPSGATACYSEAKEALHTAVGLARELGKNEVAERLLARLAHIKAVFRSQFT